MKPTIVTVSTSLDGKKHFFIVPSEQPGWPLLVGGLADGSAANTNQAFAEAEFFATAPTMFEILEMLAGQPDSTDAQMQSATERAKEIVARFKHLSFVVR